MIEQYDLQLHKMGEPECNYCYCLVNSCEPVAGSENEANILKHETRLFEGVFIDLINILSIKYRNDILEMRKQNWKTALKPETT